MQSSAPISGPASLRQADNLEQNTLSFGAPHPVRIKQQRKKMATVASKVGFSISVEPVRER